MAQETSSCSRRHRPEPKAIGPLEANRRAPSRDSLIAAGAAAPRREHETSRSSRTTAQGYETPIAPHFINDIRPNRTAGIGRVEVWRSDVRLTMFVPARFVWRCLSGSAVDPFSSVCWADVRPTADITNVTRFLLSEILP
jgi:hypothetical protein